MFWLISILEVYHIKGNITSDEFNVFLLCNSV
jgi:hypothetical protein